MNEGKSARLTRGRPSRALMLALVMCLFWSMTVPLMALTVPTSGIPSDAYEPDDTVAAATLVSVGAAPQSHTVHVATDTDWFRLSLKKGTTYVIEAMSPEGDMARGDYDGVPTALVQLELFAADGTTLIQSAGPFEYSFMPGMKFTPTSTGMYYVRSSQPVGGVFPTAQAGVTDIGPFIADGLGQYLFSVTLATAQYAGTVYDDDTGEPIAGVPIYDYYYGEDIGSASAEGVCADDSVQGPGITPGIVGYSDANGDFALYDLPYGHHHFEFGSYPPWEFGYYSYYTDCVYLYRDDETYYDDIWLEPWTTSISGTVQDTAGDPIFDCLVIAYQYEDGSYYSSWWEWTDENGEYFFGDITQGYDYLVSANYYGSLYDYTYQYWDHTDEVDEAELLYYDGDPYEGIDFTLALRPALFSGRVTDVRGKPLRDHPVWAPHSLNWMYGTAYTDMDGNYTFRGDSFTVTDTLGVYFDDYDGKHIPEWWNDTTNESSATPLAVSIASPKTGINAVLADAPPIIGGVVTDAVTDAPLKGIEAWLYKNSDWYEADEAQATSKVGSIDGWYVWDYTYTDAHGEYGFAGDLYDGEDPYRLSFFDRSGVYATEWWADKATFDEADNIWIGEGGFLNSVDSVAQMPEVEFEANAQLDKKVPRISDTTRFTTAIKLAKDAFGEGWGETNDVIIASGDDAAAADPLAAAGLTWAYDAPLLLVSKNYVPAEVLNAIKEMGEEVTVHVVGGKTSLPDATIAKITALANVVDTPDRIAGPNRYATAAAIAARMHEVAVDRDMEQPDAVLLANGADWNKFFDALAMSAVSANTGAPVLLVSATKVPAETIAALYAAKPDDVYMAGGTATISKAIFDGIDSSPATAHRWAGPTRYDTAVAVANGAKAIGWLDFSEIGVAARVPDAMSGGAAMGMKGGPLLLTETDKLPNATKTFMLYNKPYIAHCTVFGGPASISEVVRDQITQIIK